MTHDPHVLRDVARRLFWAIVLLALAGCQFEPSITPIAWSPAPPQPFQQPTLGP